MEPETAELKDGRLLMFGAAPLKAGMEPRPKIGTKIFSLSADGGRNFSPPAEWTYDDGSAFYSPSSFHRMIRHSITGKLYWLGNICATPPSGNSPRYPLIIAEIDETSAALKRSTVTAIDDRQLGQGDIQFSNFPLVEDRITHDLILHITTFGQEPDPKDWATARKFSLHDKTGGAKMTDHGGEIRAPLAFKNRQLITKIKLAISTGMEGSGTTVTVTFKNPGLTFRVLTDNRRCCQR